MQILKEISSFPPSHPVLYHLSSGSSYSKNWVFHVTVTQKQSSQVQAPSIISNYMIISSRHWSNPSLWAVCFLLLLYKMKSSSRTPLLWRRRVFLLSNQNLFRTSLYMFVPALSVVLNLNCFSSPWYLVPWYIYRKIISSFKLHFAWNSNVRNRLANLLQWIGMDRHTHTQRLEHSF